MYRGSSLEPKLRMLSVGAGVVGERCHAAAKSVCEGLVERCTSANAGMSSVRHVSKRAHRMAEGSDGRFILVGLVGPKPRPKRRRRWTNG